jgi:hypothetical protein
VKKEWRKELNFQIYAVPRICQKLELLVDHDEMMQKIESAKGDIRLVEVALKDLRMPQFAKFLEVINRESLVNFKDLSVVKFQHKEVVQGFQLSPASRVTLGKLGVDNSAWRNKYRK